MTEPKAAVLPEDDWRLVTQHAMEAQQDEAELRRAGHSLLATMRERDFHWLLDRAGRLRAMEP